MRIRLLIKVGVHDSVFVFGSFQLGFHFYLRDTVAHSNPILNLTFPFCHLAYNVFSTQGLDLDKNTMKEIYTKFGLEAGTQDFVGHAMALHLDDE